MPAKEKLKLTYFGKSDIGLIRFENQDSFGKFPPEDLNLYTEKGQLFIVADGMGGHLGGKEASSIAVNTIRDFYFSDNSDTQSSLRKAVEKANHEIYAKAGNSEQFRGMGTTCTVLLLKENKGFIVHIGDSKIYRIENNSSHKIEQLTEDHTKVHEMVKKGLLTKEEAEFYPAKSVLSRALGVEPEVITDFQNITVEKNQIFILCSDGLTGISKDELMQTVIANPPEISCNELIGLANERSGKDNVTVLIAKIDLMESSSSNDPYPSRTRKNKYILPVLFIILILLAVLIGTEYKSILPGLFKQNKNVNVINKKNSERFDDKTDNNSKALILNKLQLQADKLYEKGDLENAFIIYKKILNDKPMHLGALQGINNIAAFYADKADKYKSRRKYIEALRFYRKSLEIQPANERLNKLIDECKIYMNKNAVDTNSAAGN